MPISSRDYVSVSQDFSDLGKSGCMKQRKKQKQKQKNRNRRAMIGNRCRGNFIVYCLPL